MRPEILYPLFAPSASLKGVGAKLAPLLDKLAGPLVRDVLFMAPSGVIRRTPATAESAREGEVHTFLVTVDSHIPSRRQGQPYRIRTFDGTGFVMAIYFKVFGDHFLRPHPVWKTRALSGKVENYGGERQVAHPDYFIDAAKAAEIPTFETVYPAT